jgi:hypothetical protein
MVKYKKKEIRKKIKAGFIRKNAYNWNVSMFNDYTKINE